jgi:glyoxylase-like metal-dependent hydrolase (beta-lactamase superfamily II)
MPRVGPHGQGPAHRAARRTALCRNGRLDPLGRQDVCCDLQLGRWCACQSACAHHRAQPGSVMTGPGTNTYLVGSEGLWTVIDPGPASEAHSRPCWPRGQCGGRLERILVTHTHRDHSPGAAALAQATGVPVWGRLAAHPSGRTMALRLHQNPQHGERIPRAGCTLRVMHTPGHASNHLCYLLEEEKTLFTGDHVMQGSTVVINPPDGDMVAYLAALQALLALDLEWLAPGHGFLVAEPHAPCAADCAPPAARGQGAGGAARWPGQCSLARPAGQVYDDPPTAWRWRALAAGAPAEAAGRRPGLRGRVADGLWAAASAGWSARCLARCQRPARPPAARAA